MRLALAQIDAAVGDVEGNQRLIAGQIERARDGGADLVVLPELCLSAIRLEDLLFRDDFPDAAARRSRPWPPRSRESSPWSGSRARRGADEVPVDLINDPRVPGAHNSLAVLADGELTGTYRKVHLPNYGVFDESRYFRPGTEPAMIEFDGALVGLTVCEDIWVPGFPERTRRRLCAADRQLDGLPLRPRQGRSPRAHGRRARAPNNSVFALCNTVGGQDELIFDGRSVTRRPTAS